VRLCPGLWPGAVSGRGNGAVGNRAGLSLSHIQDFCAGSVSGLVTAADDAGGAGGGLEDNTDFKVGFRADHPEYLQRPAFSTHSIYRGGPYIRVFTLSVIDEGGFPFRIPADLEWRPLRPDPCVAVVGWCGAAGFHRGAGLSDRLVAAVIST